MACIHGLVDLTGPHRLAGLGHRPFTAVTGVRIPLGTPNQKTRLGGSSGFNAVSEMTSVRGEGRGPAEQSPRGRHDSIVLSSDRGDLILEIASSLYSPT